MKMKNFSLFFVSIIILFVFISSYSFSFQLKSAADLQILKEGNHSTLQFYQPVLQREKAPQLLLKVGLEDSEYIVQPKDTLYSIAKKFNTTVENLQKINNLGTSTVLKVGKKLKISSDELLVYSPVDKYELKFKTDKILMLISNSIVVFSPLNNGKVTFTGNISGFGLSVIIQSTQFSIIISGFNNIMVQNDQTLNLNSCVGIISNDGMLNMSIFKNQQMLSLKEFLVKSK